MAELCPSLRELDIRVFGRHRCTRKTQSSAASVSALRPPHVYLERRSQRLRRVLVLTAHTSFINRNKFSLIDSPSLVSGAGL